MATIKKIDRINRIFKIFLPSLWFSFPAESGIVNSLFHPETEKELYPTDPVNPVWKTRIK